jgi:hypothetical protein
MIFRTLVIAVWLAIGAAVLGGLYWAFLNTPESNVFTLSLSAALVALMLAIAALVANVAVLLALGKSFRESLPMGGRRVGWFVVTAAPVALLTWAIQGSEGWVAHKSGEISAWFIARFGWANPTPFFTVHNYLSVWLRWVALPVTAIALLSATLQHGTRGVMSSGWMRAAWHWRTLAIGTLAFVLLIALPWQAARWSQDRLPATWVQPAAAAARLSLIVLSVAIGTAIMIYATARQSTGTAAHGDQRRH